MKGRWSLRTTDKHNVPYRASILPPSPSRNEAVVFIYGWGDDWPIRLIQACDLELEFEDLSAFRLRSPIVD